MAFPRAITRTLALLGRYDMASEVKVSKRPAKGAWRVKTGNALISFDYFNEEQSYKLHGSGGFDSNWAGTVTQEQFDAIFPTMLDIASRLPKTAEFDEADCTNGRFNLISWKVFNTEPEDSIVHYHQKRGTVEVIMEDDRTEVGTEVSFNVSNLEGLSEVVSCKGKAYEWSQSVRAWLGENPLPYTTAIEGLDLSYNVLWAPDGTIAFQAVNRWDESASAILGPKDITLKINAEDIKRFGLDMAANLRSWGRWAVGDGRPFLLALPGSPARVLDMPEVTEPAVVDLDLI